MKSDITGIDYSFLEGEDFFAPEAGKELLNSVESSISDILDAALALPENRINKLGRAFVCADSFIRNVDVWTEIDDDTASAMLTIYRQESNEYLFEDMLAKLSVFASGNKTDLIEFEIYKDKIRRFNRALFLPEPEDRELGLSDALLKNLHRYEEQKNKESEARPMDIETGMDFTGRFTAEQIFKLISFLRNEILRTQTAS